MRPRIGLLLALLAVPATGRAEAAQCGALVAMLENLSGYELSAEPVPDAAGTCVATRTSLTRPGAPRVTVERLQLAGTEADGSLGTVVIALDGVRLVAGLNDRETDERLRSLFRLQSADIALQATVTPGTGLRIDAARIGLSGGSEVTFSADLPGAGLSWNDLVAGRLTRLDLTWKNDGRVLRPVMEALGQRLQPDLLGPAAVDAARAALAGLAGALPPSLMDDASDKALATLVAALPQGRGRLTLGFTSQTGIGAVQLGLLALSDDPTGAGALDALFSGAEVTLTWQPGLGD